jgi:hypothetical protein
MQNGGGFGVVLFLEVPLVQAHGDHPPQAVAVRSQDLGPRRLVAPAARWSAFCSSG